MSDSRSGTRIELSELEFEFEAGGFRLYMPPITIAAGERVACVGPSGSGKSTFLALLAGILQPNRGRVQIDGEDWSKFSDRVRRRRRLQKIGFVFQEFELLEHLSVRENIALPSWFAENLGDLGTVVETLTAAAGIGNLLERAPSQLSQGERQRTAVCRALAQRPTLLLADEPTGNLDSDTSHSIRDLLFEDARVRGTTLVVVTHDCQLAGEFDRVLDFAEFMA